MNVYVHERLANFTGQAVGLSLCLISSIGVPNRIGM